MHRRSHPHLRFIFLILCLSMACFIASRYCRLQGYEITAIFVQRQAIYFLLVDALYGVLALFKKL